MTDTRSLTNRIKSFFTRTAHGFDESWGPLFAVGSKSGQVVTPDSAMRSSAVFACVRVLSETIASLPLKLYKRTPDGKEEATSHWLWPLLHDSPNKHLTSYEFRETLMAHLNLRGNSYSVKEINGRGHISNLVPLNPARMKVELVGDEILYEYTWEDGKTQVFREDEIWHVKGLSTDGLVGLSPITLARESIGLSLATEEHGARVFSNDARPGGIITYPGKLKEDAQNRLKSTWQSAHTSSNAHKVAVLEEGLKWEKVSFSNDDSQFIETRNYQVEDIARVFRVPSVMIGHADKTSTFASAEQFFLNYVVYTVTPWAKRIEQSINMHLLNDRDRKKYFAEFQIDGLLRGDIKSRYEAYAIARQNKWLSANEVRKKENMNPIEGDEGDLYENPNTSTNGQLPLPLKEPA